MATGTDHAGCYSGQSRRTIITEVPINMKRPGKVWSELGIGRAYGKKLLSNSQIGLP